MNKISLVSIVLNEEYYLKEFLDNVKGIFDECVFVDGGSKDRTVEIIQLEGHRVELRKFDLDFSAQKNFALDAAKNKWRFVLDADETLSNGLKKFISDFKNAVSVDQNKALAFFRDNYLDGGGQDDSPLDFTIRMFADRVRFVNKVHEQPSGYDVPFKTILAGRIYHKKDSYRQYRANLLYEYIKRGIQELPIDLGAFNDDGRLRLVKLLSERQIEITNDYLEGPLLNV